MAKRGRKTKKEKDKAPPGGHKWTNTHEIRFIRGLTDKRLQRLGTGLTKREKWPPGMIPWVIYEAYQKEMDRRQLFNVHWWEWYDAYLATRNVDDAAPRCYKNLSDIKRKAFGTAEDVLKRKRGTEVDAETYSLPSPH